VLGQIPLLSGFLDLLSDFLSLEYLQILQFILILLQACIGQNIFLLCHFLCFLPFLFLARRAATLYSIRPATFSHSQYYILNPIFCQEPHQPARGPPPAPPSRRRAGSPETSPGSAAPGFRSPPPGSP